MQTHQNNISTQRSHLSLSGILLISLIATLLSQGVMGCSTWDDEAIVPEDFRSSYIKLHEECEVSVHPAAEYVVTYLSPNGREVWEAYSEGDMNAEFSTGVISVKAQYSDESCSNLTGYTVMEKVSEDTSGELGGWRWQYLNNAGECINCDGGTGCSGCHAGCTAGPDYFCTVPESM